MAAVGRLLGLTVDQRVPAFGICRAFAPLPSAKRWNWDNRPLSWTKDMAAWPSMAGINAALLAGSGLLDPCAIFEGLTRQALLERLSLRRLEPYLRGATTVGLVHNADDIILGPGELQYLEGVFGARARVFPTGGHLGNVFHPEVVRAIVGFLTGQDN